MRFGTGVKVPSRKIQLPAGKISVPVPMTGEEAKTLACPGCGYTWESRSSSARVCCPKCKKGFKREMKKK
jgi:protein-arginine kinase activator protein McsA